MHFEHSTELCDFFKLHYNNWDWLGIDGPFFFLIGSHITWPDSFYRWDQDPWNHVYSSVSVQLLKVKLLYSFKSLPSTIHCTSFWYWNYVLCTHTFRINILRVPFLISSYVSMISYTMAVPSQIRDLVSQMLVNRQILLSCYSPCTLENVKSQTQM